MKYELLRAETVGTLSGYVNEKLALGWELYGDPSTSAYSREYSSTVIFIQAVIFRD